MNRGGKRLLGACVLLSKAFALTLITGLIGFYSPSETYHYVKNGFPLPFLMQVIDIRAARYVGIKLDPLFLFLDILVWVCLILLFRVFTNLLRRTFPPGVK